MVNQEIAAIFDRMANVLAFQGANRFRIQAYRRGAASLRDLKTDLAQLPPASYQDIPAIGEDLAEMIGEYLHTHRIRRYEEARRGIPDSLLDLMDIPGMGPKTLQVLHKALSVDSLDKLKHALSNSAIFQVPGFGQKRVDNLLAAIETWAGGRTRISLGLALPLAEEFLTTIRLNPLVLAADLAGSLRRGQDTIGDIDLVLSSLSPARALSGIARLPVVKSVVSQGPTRLTLLLEGPQQVDIRAVEPASYGAALQYFTGSKQHNIHLRSLAHAQGLKINEYGIYRASHSLGGDNEHDIYQALGLPFIPPELREDQGEIEAARDGSLPSLIQPSDLQGDLHVHSHYSDGRDSLPQLLDAAATLGYQYLGISDHSPSARIARGLNPERLAQKLDELHTLRDRQPPGRPLLLAGAEVDILPDGRLDYPDALLKQLDVVIVSVHSAFRQPSGRMTGRILDALDHPRVHILAHPTARLLGSRPPVDFDYPRILERAARRGVALELNGSSLRLDLNAPMARLAHQAGCLLSIASDAHSASHLSDVRFAILQARRAWLPASALLNTWPTADLLRWLRQRIPLPSP